MANILEFYGHRQIYGLAVSPNPLHRNPSYTPINNPDMQIRKASINYVVWDLFSAARSPFFADKILQYAAKYHGRIIHIQSVSVTNPGRHRPSVQACYCHLRGAPMMRQFRIISTFRSMLVLSAGIAPAISPAVQAAPAAPAQPTATAPTAVLLSPSDGLATTTPIKHLIVLMQENHTFDNYFGTYPGGGYLPANVKMPVNPADPGKEPVCGSIPYRRHCPKRSQPQRRPLTDQYDNGRMDGFVSALDEHKQDGRLAMGYD